MKHLAAEMYTHSGRMVSFAWHARAFLKTKEHTVAYKAVIFDLDGTLLNSLEDIADSMNTVLESFGLPTHDLNEYNFFVGKGIKVLVEQALPESERHPEQIEQCLTVMQRVYGQHCMDKTQPYNGIPELLTALADRGIRKAILSNKPHESTKIVVKALLSEWTFEQVVGVSAETPRKPDIKGVTRIISDLELDPDHNLYVGDTNVDMQTAVNANLMPVGALWGFRSKAELLANGAKALLNHPSELLKLL